MNTIFDLTSCQTQPKKQTGIILPDTILNTGDTVSDILSRDEKSASMKQRESDNKVLELEKTNFRIDSTGWNVIDTVVGRVKINPLGDVCEYTEWICGGEQIFTQKSAIRETAKAGKQMPSTKQW